jgi:hypothetical protein
MITKENIEAYLLDFLEGNLKTNEFLELETFLIENPTFKPDFELLYLDQYEPIDFNKESLKKKTIFEPDVFQAVQEGTIEEKILVSATENVFTEAEMVHFNNYLIDNLDAQKEFSIYQKTRLAADDSIVFPNVSRLKRKKGKVFVFNSLTKWSAAAIVVGIGFWLFFGSNSMQRNVVTKKIPNLRKEVTNPQAEKSIYPTKNFTHIQDYKLNQQQLLKPTLVQSKDSIIEPKETFSAPIEMANETNVLDTSESKTYINKNETLLMNKLAKISPDASNTLTPIEFVNSRLKKRFFGKDDPSKEEMYASVSNKISSFVGIPFLFIRKQEKGNHSLYFRIGKFSIEKN